MEVIIRDWYSSLKAALSPEETITGSASFASASEWSSALAVSSDVGDLGDRLHLSGTQMARMSTLIDAVRTNDRERFAELGMPMAAWPDFTWLIQKLLASGFAYIV